MNKPNWIDKVKNYKMPERTKNILWGLLVILVIVGFAKSVLGIYKAYKEREIAELKHNNDLADLREQRAKKKSDSAIAVTIQLKGEINGLKGDVRSASGKIDNIQTSLDKDIFELKNLRNEKNYIPTVSTDEQSQYLSKYKYSEY